MLNISGLNEGVVLDHIEAGKSLDIYYNLGLDKLDIPRFPYLKGRRYEEAPAL